MDPTEEEEQQLRSVALQNAQSIRLARHKAEQELIQAKEALEQRTIELAHSLAMMHATLESTTDAILVTNGVGIVTGYNERYVEMWQIPREVLDSGEHSRILETTRRQFRNPQAFMERIEEIYASSPTESYDLLELEDGRVFERFSRIQFVEERNVGRVWSFRDISQRKHVEEALRESNERLRASIAASGTGTFRWDIQANRIDGDEALNQLFGLPATRTAYTIESLIKCVHPDDRLAVMKLCDQCARNGGDMDMEFRVVWPDATFHWLDCKARVMPDENGEPHYMMGACIDITARKRASLELEEARDDALNASRAKSTFLANMSHELRTPLNAIIGYSEMLEEQAAETELEHFRDDLHRIHAAGRHLLNVINDILDLSKIEAGKMEVFVSPFEICALVSEVTGTAQPLLDSNSNILQVICAPQVGVMLADETKVRQVLYNLISNAAKFTERGTVTVEVSRDRIDEADWIILKVSDTGIGMDNDQIANLFREFTQVDPSTTRRHGGTGLGLAISRRFCRMMGGDIQVSSQLGTGSAFTASIPAVVQGHQSDLAGFEADDYVALSAVSHPTPVNTILIIDDEPAVHDLMRHALEKEGFHVVSAMNSRQGIELARSHRPQAITLDILMPEIDGWSVLSELKSDPGTADIPVIIVSIVDDRNLGFSLGAADYLTKPVERERLLSVLRRFKCDLKECDVLIVEDDPDTRMLLSRLLNNSGCVTTDVENGRVALEALGNYLPDIILLDLMMPEMDGFEFLEQKRRVPEWRRIPVVVITAKVLTPEERERMNGQVQRFLFKGQYTGTELLREICDILVTFKQDTFTGARTNT